MSGKKMHPPVVLHSTGQTSVKGNLLSAVSATGAKSVTAKDRQNAENIVPSQNGNSGKEETLPQTNGPGSGTVSCTKKCNSKTITVAPTNVSKIQQTTVGPSAISSLNSINRRKSHRIHSPNRKRQEQQNIFNSLKAWNVKIAPSSQAPVKSEFGARGTCDAPSKNAGKEIAKANSESSSTASTSAPSNVSSNTSDNSTINSCSISTSSNSGKHGKKNEYPLMIAAAAALTTAVLPKETESAPVMEAQNSRKVATTVATNESNQSSSTTTVGEQQNEAPRIKSPSPSVATVGGGETRSTGGPLNAVKSNKKLHQPQQIIHQQLQQQPRQHLQKHFHNYYDDMLVQTANGGGDSAYTSFGIPDHLGSSTNGGTTNGGTSSDTGLAYCYSQNHQHHLHHNHPTQQQPQQQHQHQHQPNYCQGDHQNHHHNNNYQHHNRNYGRGGHSAQQHGGSGNPPPMGKRSWNNNWHSGKKVNMMHGKYGNRNSGFNHGYRKSYHYYSNHHNNGHQQQYDHHQGHQQEHVRNLVYIRGYDRGYSVPGSQHSVSRSPTPSPQSESPAIDTREPAEVENTLTSHQDEKSDSGIEEIVRNLKKCTVPSSSSSSSSMASIPSTDSSAVSSSVSQNLSLELNCGTGPGYESDSSHSSSYKSHTYRHRKYTNGGQVYRSSSSTSSGVSSSAAFPPISTSTATTPQVADFFLRSQSYHGSHQNLGTVSGGTSPNPPGSPVGTARSLIGTQSMPMFSELFTGTQLIQHQQQQQQQQQQQHQPQSHPGHQPHQNGLYGSNSSLELSLHTGTGSSSANSNVSNCSTASNGSSSGYSSAPPSTVPPNEIYSMQSGHPKRRYSGRSSPVSFTAPSKPSRPSSSTTNASTETSYPPSQQQQQQKQAQTQTQSQPLSPSVPAATSTSTSSSSSSSSTSLTLNRKSTPVWSQHRPLTVPVSTATTASASAAVSQPPPASLPPPPLPLSEGSSNFHTPADRFLARSHLVELVAPPEDLAPPGSKWAPLSTAIWKKFAGAQQTQHKFVQKIHLWRYLFMCIRKAFPRFSLYLVGSTISGFACDSSDVDMCLVCRSNTVPFDMRGEALFQLGQLKNYFMNISTYFEEFSVIQAKVPILRFRDTTNSIVVDLNYNNSVGIRNTHLLYCYSQMDWRVRPLTLVVKMWAQHHNINDAKNMTISSYSLVLMVIHFLQYGVSPPILPCLHAMHPDKFVVCESLQRMSDFSNLDLTETVEPYKNDNSQSLGELFLQFLEYYANFDYTHYAISVRTASVIPIESARVARSYKNDPHHWRQLCIEEPFDLTNTARSVFDAEIFEQIKSVFSTCWRRLKDTNDLNAIFECEPLFIPVASALSLTS
ncbi:poly(A) RNA polymerase gld-2 homolog B-like isoform X3 [Malaya genurostris]|uniref:poly(A) RNA polymerase gld-2 homolog B-like isoform X3 n=1 Tax=Malaya genurostris TaxID=325434 RepID=UPI0026F3A349|nr:poly(A) RNA polymerase gld-2 homolog B-like isoform X3 [Malaya genurostris]